MTIPPIDEVKRLIQGAVVDTRLRFERASVTPLHQTEFGDGWSVGWVSPGQDRVHDWGYATGPQWEDNHLVLKRDGEVWAGLNRREAESHAVHLHVAKGTVVACGARMGAFAYNAIQKPGVHRVFVVDHYADLMEYLKDAAHEMCWPNAHKLTFVTMAPALLTRRHLSEHGFQEVPDLVYMDGWCDRTYGLDVKTLKEIQKNLQPRTVGFRAQEVALIDWAAKHGRLDTLDLDDFDAWCLDNDMVLHHRSTDYMKYALVVYGNLRQRMAACLTGVRTRKRRKRK